MLLFAGTCRDLTLWVCEIKNTSRFTSCQPIHITSVSTAANDHASQALKQAYTHPWVLGSPSYLSHFQGNDTVDNFLIQRGDSAYAAGVWLASAEKLQSISYREMGSDYVFTQGKQVLLRATTHSGVPVVHYASHRHIYIDMYLWQSWGVYTMMLLMNTETSVFVFTEEVQHLHKDILSFYQQKLIMHMEYGRAIWASTRSSTQCCAVRNATWCR